MNLAPTPLRVGEGLKHSETSTENNGFKASLPVGERFGEGFLAPLNSHSFNLSSMNLSRPASFSLPTIYGRGLEGMVMFVKIGGED